MRYRSPGRSVFCSSPMKKIAWPSRTIPTCSWGWECSSTTACGWRSTTESIIFSAAAVRMVTPGKIVCWPHSSGVGKKQLTASSNERGGASFERTHPPLQLSTDCSRCKAAAEHAMYLGALADDERHGRGVEGNGAQAAVALPRTRFDRGLHQLDDVLDVLQRLQLIDAGAEERPLVQTGDHVAD